MRRTMLGGVLGAGLGWGLATVSAVPALAQTIPMPGQSGFQPIVKPDDTGAKGPDYAPAALPGARPGRGAAPADKSVTDMAPNDALFDAINRGDINEARDAVNRGADVHSVNVLGMTPLELSVDLSRNDITFFLLSLRGASGGALSPKAAAAAAPATAPAPVAAKPAPTRRTRVAKASRPAGSSDARPYAVSSADPGQPDPQAGFLGFGGSGNR